MFPSDDVIMNLTYLLFFRFDYDDENFQEIMGNINTVFRGNPLYTATDTIDGAFKLAMLISTVTVPQLVILSDESSYPKLSLGTPFTNMD